MMEFLKNLSIRTKLFLLSVIPSLGLIYALSYSISDSLDRKNSTLEVYQDCDDVEKFSALLHAFQEERGFYLSFLTDCQSSFLSAGSFADRRTHFAHNPPNCFCHFGIEARRPKAGAGRS